MIECSEPLTWTVHLASERPVKAGLALVLISFILGMIYQLTSSFFFVGLGIVVFLCVLAPFFQRVTFCIDQAGVSRTIMGFRRKLPWTRIQSYIADQHRIFVYNQTRTGLFRSDGILLLFGKDQEEFFAKVKVTLAEI